MESALGGALQKSILFITGLVVVGCSNANNLSGGSGQSITQLIPNQYIVAFKQNSIQAAALDNNVSAEAMVQSMASELAIQHHLPEADRVFTHALQGGVYQMDVLQALQVAQDPNVAYVEQDQVVRVEATQNNATWGLDRIDQASLPLNKTYSYPTGGSQVNVYVVDTGILMNHSEFQGRALFGFDAIDANNKGVDCAGHGTHVAGTIGSVTYGVAKTVKLYSVRVLDCAGTGTISGVIAGVDWVTKNHVKPAVANMSLGAGASQAADDAVVNAVKAGVTFVVAAGNSSEPACNFSPSRVPQAITVGSTNNADVMSEFSNTGSCVDIFAPGSDILSTWYTSTTATATISGTSMASPHVVGVAALYLAQRPSAAPAEVESAIKNNGVSNKLIKIPSGTPNLLLNTAFLNAVTPPPVTDPLLQNGVAVNGLSGAKGSQVFYAVNVPANSKNLVITLSGGSGDADLYTKVSSRPGLFTYDCRPYTNGNSESCKVSAPVAGTYYIMLNGYAAYSGVSLKATYQ